jgi:hypothetical protein
LANEVEDTFVAFFQDKESGKQEKFHEILELFNKCMSERVRQERKEEKEGRGWKLVQKRENKVFFISFILLY